MVLYSTVITFNRISEILEDAKQVHSGLRNQVDFNLEDKKHAMYLLQGGILTAITTALRFNNEGLLAPRAQQKRMIDEIIDLITFFDEVNENSRQLRAWFSGKVVERTTGNKGNLTAQERATRVNLTPAQVRYLDELRKKSNLIMSQYMHPTIEVVRANVFRKTHLFDYNHRYTSSLAIFAKDFGNLYVVPGLHALLLPARVLTLSESDFHRLRNYDKEIQSSV